MNATYIISIARKLGCSIFLLPEDVTEVLCRARFCFLSIIHDTCSTMVVQVNQKMILTLTASIMYWFMKQPVEEKASVSSDSENGSNHSETISNSTSDDSASDSSIEETGNV